MIDIPCEYVIPMIENAVDAYVQRHIYLSGVSNQAKHMLESLEGYLGVGDKIQELFSDGWFSEDALFRKILDRSFDYLIKNKR